MVESQVSIYNDGAKFPDVALLEIRVHKGCSKAILYSQRNVHLISRLVIALNPILR